MSLLQMSISGAIMILAVIVIRALAINRLPKKTFIVLWGIVLLRLLVPFSFPSPFSAYSLVNQHIFTPQDAVVLENANVIPAPPVDLPTTGDAVMQGQTAASISPYAIAWGIGLIVCALFFTVSYFKCRREFQESLPIKNDFLTQWIAEHKLSRPIEIRQSSRISAPLTYGVFKPIILMPKSTKWDDTKQIEYILAHEFVHIRRFDAAAKLLLTATLCIHWFNPLIWAMYILSNRDIELSCDETVVRSFGETTKSTYARTLISMEEKKSTLTPLCNNFSKNAIEERITAIMKIKKTSVVATFVASTLIVGVTTAFATSAAASDKSLTEIPYTDFAQSDNNQLLDRETLEMISSKVEKSISPYVSFGITYKLDAEGQAKFYWNGTQVRGIYDEATGIWVSNSSGNSTFDESVKELYAVYTGQKLTGLREATAQEQEEWTNIRNHSSNNVSFKSVPEVDTPTVIDLTSTEPFRVTAGSGPEQAYDYSEAKQTYFTFAQGQKLQVDVDYISAFHTTTSGNSIKLIFMDSQQHTVEVIIKEGEKGEVIFENSGVYSLSIQNDGTNSLAYSFILN